MLFRSPKTKFAIIARRTFLLTIPVPTTSFLIKNSSYSGFGNTFVALLSNPEEEGYAPAPILAKAFSERTLPSGVMDYGNLFVYKKADPLMDSDDEDEELKIRDYHIEQLSPFNPFLYGYDYGFKRGTITGETGDKATDRKAKEAQIPSTILDEKIKFSLDTNNKTPGTLAKYTFSKTDFTASSIREKGDLSLLVDLEIKLSEAVEPVFSVTAIDLSQLISVEEQSIPILSIKSKLESEPIEKDLEDYFLKVSKNNDISIELSLEKKGKNPQSSRQKRSATTDPQISSPVEEISVRNFYILFSENPSVFYEKIFTTNSNIDANIFGETARKVKKIFLDRWSNSAQGLDKKSKNTNSSSQDTKFSFDVQDGFWKSFCSDPYKVGGFIDTDPSTAPKPKTDDQTVTGTTFVAKQKSVYEKFDPNSWREEDKGSIKDATKEDFYPTKPYTTPTPCEDLDNDTKTLFKEFAFPASGQTQKKLEREQHEYIDVTKIPQAIKDKLNGSSSTQQRTGKSKIIQGSFRAWGGDYLIPSESDAKGKGIYNPQYEQSNQSKHFFELKIEKDKLTKKLIEHEKLKEVQDGSTKPLYELQEISTQIKVFMPFSFTVYDPVSNYLKKEKINLNVDLDLKSIYNQSQFTKEFFIYDLGVHHKQLGLDFGGYELTKKDVRSNPYGLSGTLTFSAGLFLDVEQNLHVRLNVNTKGFVNTKNPTCDLRNRVYKWTGTNKDKCTGSADGWSYRKHNHIPPFIVIEIDQDPTVSSFYVDRRSGVNSSVTSSATKQTTNQRVDTLKSFKDSLSNRTVNVVKVMDQTNNAEVYFERIDVSDPNSRKAQQNLAINATGDKEKGGLVTSNSANWFSTSSWNGWYYVPRRNEGSIDLEDKEKLDSITMYLEGSASIGGVFFKSLHYNTIATRCTSTKYKEQVKTGDECADGIKYESIEKDKKAAESIDTATDAKDLKITISWDELQKTNSSSASKEFNFQTIIHRAGPGESGKDNNKFDSSKNKLEYIFKETGSVSSQNFTYSSAPSYSLTAAWYTVNLWYDSTNNKICYYTQIRPISSIASLGTQTGTAHNSDAHKVVGASAKVGFQVAKVELEYKKKN